MSIRMLAANAFWSLLNQVSSRGSLMLSAIFLARSLKTADFSAYSYFQLTISMLAAYAGMGMGVTASRYFAVVGHEKPDQGALPLGLLWAISIVFAIIASSCILLMPTNWISAGFPVPRWVLALGVLVLALQVVPSGAIMGLEKYKAATAVSVISGACMLAGAWLAIRENSAVLAMIAIILASAVQLIGESFVVLRVVGFRNILMNTVLRWHAVRQVFSFAGPMMLVTLLAASGAWLLGRIIAHTGGDQSFALYSVGMQWFALALVIPGMISRVILPRVVRTEGSTVAARKMLIRQGAAMATLTAAVIFIIGMLLSPQIMKFYGGQYSDHIWLAGAYLAAAIFIAPANTLGNAIVANSGQQSWLFITSAWLATLLLTGYFTSAYGAWSGAIALSSAAIAQTILAFIIARSRKLV